MPDTELTDNKDKKLFYIIITVLVLGLGLYAPQAVKKSYKSDFERYLYAGKMASEGGDIYQHADDLEFKYFPIFAQLMIPVHKASILIYPSNPLKGGALIWYVFLCVCYLGTVSLITSICKPQSRRQWLLIAFGAVLLSCRFFVANVRNGQINMPVMFLGILGCWLILRDKQRLGGVAIALGAAVKFMPAVLLVWLAATRRWRAFVWFWLGLLLFIYVVPSLSWGVKGNHQMLCDYVCRRHKMVTDVPREEAAGQSIPSLTNRLLRKVNAAPLRKRETNGRVTREPIYINVADLSPDKVKKVAGITVLLFTLLALILINKVRKIPQSSAMVLALLFMLMLLISPEARKAHFVTLVVPGAAMTALALQQKRYKLLIPLVISLATLLIGSHEVLGRWEIYFIFNAYGILLFVSMLLFTVISILILKHKTYFPVTEPNSPEQPAPEK